jgi:hypothetical protein
MSKQIYPKDFGATYTGILDGNIGAPRRDSGYWTGLV